MQLSPLKWKRAAVKLYVKPGEVHYETLGSFTMNVSFYEMQTSNQMLEPYLRLCVLVAAAFLTSSCHSLPPNGKAVASPDTHLVDPQAEAMLLKRIQAEISDARCSADSQCRTLPIGEKSCGGPVSWVPWSVSVSNGEQLRIWTAQLAAMQRRRNEISGAMSNCQYIADPGASCVAQHCELRRLNHSN